MFGIFSGNASLFAGRRDPTKEKAAPPRATPILFPVVNISPCQEPLSGEMLNVGELEKQVAGIRKPSDLNVSLLQSFKLQPASSIAVSQLVPEHVVPPEAKLHNGRAFPTNDDFDARSKEITLPNSTGYAVLAGKLRGDKNAPRIMQFRRFWEGLESMSNYWDTSLDEYIPPGEGGDDSERSSLISPKSTPPPSGSGPSKRPRTSFAEEERPSRAACTGEPDGTESLGTYRGYRMSNGANMPEQHRVDTVRAFLEPILWPFGFTIQQPRRPPLLAIGSVRVPVRMTHSVWRIPKEREKAQGKWVEGPVLGVSCRNETGFAPDGVSSLVDTTQELCTLLFLAQERAREGKTEVKPGEGKWWTSVPRWGGGPGGEAGEVRADEDQKPTAEEPPQPARDIGSTTQLLVDRRKSSSRRPDMYEVWRTLKPGSGYWDPKADYQRIGRDANTESDQVYLVSSLNHHVSLLKLEVHPAYLHRLNGGETAGEQQQDSDWQHPKVSRSRWFDVFSTDDRLEVMSALWRLTSYLARVESY